MHPGDLVSNGSLCLSETDVTHVRCENGRDFTVNEILRASEDGLQYRQPAKGADERPEMDNIRRLFGRMLPVSQPAACPPGKPR